MNRLQQRLPAWVFRLGMASILVVIVGVAKPTAAADHGARADGEAATHDTHQGQSNDGRQPELSKDSHWARWMVLTILILFAAAWGIGWVVRSQTPEEVPPAHSHDEPPGASHHHGASGQLNPEPDHGHAGGHH